MSPFGNSAGLGVCPRRDPIHATHVGYITSCKQVSLAKLWVCTSGGRVSGGQTGVEGINT